MVTLQDIADRVGVTRTVVSHVLGNRLGKIRVSEVRRKEIIKVAKELGYVGNRSARTLATRRNRSLGLVVNYRRFEKLTTGGYATIFNILEGMRAVGSRRGYQSVHAIADLRRDAIFEMPDFIRERSVDAIAVYGYMHQSIAKQFLETGLPCLHIGRNVEEDSGIHNVSTHMDKAICRAVDHAVAAGVGSTHLYLPNGPGPKRIADVFLKHVARSHPNVRATAAFGQESIISYEEGRLHGEHLGKQRKPPELLFTSIDKALPLLVSLKKCGFHCPEDFQIVVFSSEGAHEARLGETGLLLSQIVIPYCALGELVAQQFIDLLEGQSTGLQDVRIDCLFELGETAPALSPLDSPEIQTNLFTLND